MNQNQVAVDLPQEATSSPTEATNAAHSSRKSALEALRHALEQVADPGTLAALRRMDPACPPPAFFRLMAASLDDILPPDGQARDLAETSWALVSQAMAMATGGRRGSSLLGRVPFGQALAQAGVAEMRLLRLLNASGEQRHALVRGVVHQLVSAGQTFDPSQLADLVLARDDDAEERARRSIARQFYRHVTG